MSKAKHLISSVVRGKSPKSLIESMLNNKPKRRLKEANALGKFEGEADYAEHFYNQVLDGMGEDVYTKYGLVSLLDVTPEDIAKFPELEGKAEVAFMESDQGFWEEMDVDATKAAAEEYANNDFDDDMDF